MRARHLHLLPAPATPASAPPPPPPKKPDVRGWPMSGPRPRGCDPAETETLNRARSLLYGFGWQTGSAPPPLTLDEARAIVAWHVATGA